jgi:nucleotide-binding universal stress UspA family protein
MGMYERILVPLDGSNAGEMVLPYAAEIASKTGIELILVSVSEVTGDARDPLYHIYLERITEQVEHQLEDWGAQGAARVRNEVLAGDPASEILRYADEGNVSLIAMASRGRSEHAPWLLGNIAAKVLRATAKPVLLVRTPADTAALQQRSLVKRILVPLDGSQVGEAALPYAVGLAQELGAELVFYQVLKHVVLVAAEGATMSSAMYEEEEKHRRASAMAYLESVAKDVREKGLSASSAVGSGAPADQIIDYAEANAIDLIAMSTHGRSGITRWVFGSVTDKVLHAGNSPVLTVRASKNTAG